DADPAAGPVAQDPAARARLGDPDRALDRPRLPWTPDLLGHALPVGRHLDADRLGHGLGRDDPRAPRTREPTLRTDHARLLWPDPGGLAPDVLRARLVVAGLGDALLARLPVRRDRHPALLPDGIALHPAPPRAIPVDRFDVRARRAGEPDDRDKR